MIVDRNENDILRVQAQQASLFGLLKGGVPTMEPSAAWRALTRALAETLEVQRATIWLLTPDTLRLRLVCEHGTATPGRVRELQAPGYPGYFAALLGSRTIVAPDAMSDPRTRELAQCLKDNGVISLLDAGIWRAGEVSGVVCAESVGERRAWTTDEQLFAGSIADLAAAVLTHENLVRARAQLEESEELFSRALRSSPDWISVVRMSDGVILHVNEAFERESGHSAVDVIGRSTMELDLWARPDERKAWVERLEREGLVRDHEVEFRKKSGELRTFLLSGHRVDIRGAECVVTNSRDVTERRRQERLVQDIARGVGAEIGESFFRSLVDHLAQVLGADMAFVGELKPGAPATVRTVAVNSGGAAAADFEYLLEGSPCAEVLAGGTCAYPNGVAQRFPGDPGLARRGIESYVGAALIGASGQPLGLVAVLFRRPLTDLALAENLLKIFAVRASGEMERRRQLQSLEHQTHHDPLTGLPNRLHLRERMEEGMKSIAARGGRGALLLVDLDRFKEINDTLGHHVGDAMLIRLSRRLESEMRSFCNGVVARLGGDEFAIWVEDLASDASAEIAATRALAAITAPLEIEGYRLEVDASIGIALAPEHSDAPAGLLRCADVAMYDAKRNSAGHMTYEAAQDPYSAERLTLLSELGSAIRRGELEVHYQPRLHLASGKLSGFEALVRWRHPRLGLLSPARFIPLAELSDVIRPLTLWVLGTALAQRRAWGMGGRMAVNLSARHLLDDSCPEQIARIVAENAADPSLLELEITESALIADPERARATLERIRDQGVRIAIDDFGTGYSSLSHLKRLPLHALKIDVSFVRQMLASAADGVIVDTTISLAHQLGLSVAAEGIEDEATFAVLRDHGCDEGQGYLIARPMPAPEAERWMRSSGHA